MQYTRLPVAPTGYKASPNDPEGKPSKRGCEFGWSPAVWTTPRRIGIKIASPTSERVIGRCLSFAKSMVRFASIHPLFFSPTFWPSPPRHTRRAQDTFDLLLKSC